MILNSNYFYKIDKTKLYSQLIPVNCLCCHMKLLSLASCGSYLLAKCVGRITFSRAKLPLKTNIYIHLCSHIYTCVCVQTHTHIYTCTHTLVFPLQLYLGGVKHVYIHFPPWGLLGKISVEPEHMFYWYPISLEPCTHLVICVFVTHLLANPTCLLWCYLMLICVRW